MFFFRLYSLKISDIKIFCLNIKFYIILIYTIYINIYQYNNRNENKHIKFFCNSFFMLKYHKHKKEIA